MKKTIITLMALSVILWSAIIPEAHSAGSATWETVNYQPDSDANPRFRIYRCSWTSDAAGSVSSGTGVESKTVSGLLLEVNFKSVSGSVPSNLYDVEMLAVGGNNIFYDSVNDVNVGADIPSALNANGQRRTPYNKDGYFKSLHEEILTPSITNAGNAKSGIIELIVW